MSSTWRNLSLAPGRLAAARLQCHHAVQINTRLARGFVPPQADDSHTSLVWDSQLGSLTGQPFEAGGRVLCGSLRVRDLTFQFNGADLALEGLSVNDALLWLGDRLKASGLDPSPLFQPLHFELDDHPLRHGAKFEASPFRAELEELSNYYGNAALSIGSLAQPVRCWPHHFDIAALMSKGEGTIGMGMSPGDASYAEPYFYVSPSPYPASDRLPALRSLGHWHTEEWTGAVLTGSQFEGKDDQEALVRTFLEDALHACQLLS